jgi:hypothetical protein
MYAIPTVVTTLPADDPGKLRPGWTIEEKMGTPVFHVSRFFAESQTGDTAELLDGGWSVIKETDKSLKIRYSRFPGIAHAIAEFPVARDLSLGDRVALCGLFGYYLADVSEIDGNKASAKDGNSLFVLEKDKADGWVCIGQVNMSAIAKLTIELDTTEEEKS